MTTSKLAELAKKRKPSPTRINSSNILFWGTGYDKSYLPYLKSCMGGANAFVRTDAVHTLIQVLQHCKQKEVTQVITTYFSLAFLTNEAILFGSATSNLTGVPFFTLQ